MHVVESWFCYLVRFSDGSFMGSPTDTRTTNPNLAGAFGRTELARCQDAARALDGEIVKFQDGKILPFTPNA